MNKKIEKFEVGNLYPDRNPLKNLKIYLSKDNLLIIIFSLKILDFLT